MKPSIAIATGFLALGLVANLSLPVRADPGPWNYPYCGMHTSGATVCYFMTFLQCKNGGNLSCVENPGYIGPPDDPDYDPEY